MSRGKAAAAAFALALWLGCGDEPAPTAPTQTPAATAPPAAPRRAAAPTVRIRRQPDGTLRVRAERAPRGDVLRELARAAGFALSGSPSPRTVDLELASAPAEEIVAALLPDVPYHLHFGPAHGDPEASELLRVTVGALAAPARATRSSANPSPPRRDEGEPRAKARTLARGEASGEPMEGDPAELAAALAGAPDPATRAAAARGLGDVDGGEDAFRAAQSLTRALGDRDPEVVAAAIGALEEIHDLIPDPAHVTAVKRLRDHADPRVRSAAAAFLEWTDEGR